MPAASKLRTLREAIDYLADPDRCLPFAAALRWPGGVACPTCKSRDVVFIATRRLWKCRNQHRRQQFSIRVGTIFEDSPIGLDKWFAAIWIVANQPDDVTPREIARHLEVTPKTAWFMLHRIRLAMRTGSFEASANAIAGERGEEVAGPGVLRFRSRRDADPELRQERRE